MLCGGDRAAINIALTLCCWVVPSRVGASGKIGGTLACCVVMSLDFVRNDRCLRSLLVGANKCGGR